MALAIVTGASRGLGFENAKCLAALGHDIVLIAKDSDRLLLAQQSLQSSHPNQKFSTYAVDLEDMQATRKTVELIAQQHDSPEILILAHGVMSEKMSKTLKTTDAEWRRVMSINLDSVFTIVNGLVPAMAEARNGRVIIYSACLGRMSGPGNAGGLAPYRISKAGVNAFVRNLAHETGLGARCWVLGAGCWCWCWCWCWSWCWCWCWYGCFVWVLLEARNADLESLLADLGSLLGVSFGP